MARSPLVRVHGATYTLYGEQDTNPHLKERIWRTAIKKNPSRISRGSEY